MAQARLRIDKYLEGERLTGGAVVDVRRIDKNRGRGTRIARIAVPMGSELSGAEGRLDLEPGVYEFTAILPSGDVLSQIAEVDARVDGVPIVFEMEHSSHEWMSWQHALGNVVGANTRQSTRAAAVKPFLWLADDISARMFSVESASSGPDSLAMKLSTHLADAWMSKSRKSIDIRGSSQSLLYLKDDPFKVFQIPTSGRIDYLNRNFLRSYALVEDGANRQMLCVLPYPWRKSSGGEAMVELLVGPDQPLDADETTAQYDVPWSVSTIARDDQVASVLSYFAAGDDSAATFLAATAQDLLFYKLDNPFAASAGAYVLIDQWLRDPRTDTVSVRWLAWLQNLANWFPWLPDGQILRGWVAIAGRAGRESVELARAAFLDAERRGIPIYTAGVRRLADGLARIVNQDKADGREDRGVIEALERIRRVAWGADARFPFTTIRLWLA